MPPGKNDHLRGLRGEVGGWSVSSTRSNTRFLYSVIPDELTGQGWALSLTVKTCPPSHAEWHKARRAFLKRLERMGLIRGHWLTEWQRRGVPHLHCAIWLPSDCERQKQHDAVREAWLAVATVWGAQSGAQHVAPITNSKGWFKYLSKHASRGLGHYQRAKGGIPKGWRSTGRMWGYVGSWEPVRMEVVQFQVCWPGWFAYRRIVRRYRIADARADTGKGRGRRIRQARKMLQFRDRARGSVRGISEWIDFAVTQRMLVGLGAAGYRVSFDDGTRPGVDAGRSDWEDQVVYVEADLLPA